VVVLLVPAWVAIRVTVAVVATLPIVTLNVAVVLPAATVTVAGTLAAAELELESVTTSPPVGAAPVSVTVPVIGVAALLAMTGVTVKESSVGGRIVRVACSELSPFVAVTVPDVAVATAVVVAVNLAVDEPAATVTLTGTVIDFVEDESLTTMAVSAVALSVTRPAELAPPVTLVGERVTELTANGFTVRIAVSVTPPYDALMVTVSVAVTKRVVIGNVPVDPPRCTLTDAGTVATLVFELVNVIVIPAVGAWPLRVTVPSTGTDDLPITELGEREMPASDVGWMASWADLETVPIEKVAELDPLAILSVTGIVVSAELDDRLIETPPTGAAPVKETVPTAEVPPPTAVGEIVSDESTAG